MEAAEAYAIQQRFDIMLESTRDSGVQLAGGPLDLADEVLAAQGVQGVANAGAHTPSSVANLGVCALDLLPADEVGQDGFLELADDVVHQTVGQDAAQQVVTDEGVAGLAEHVVRGQPVNDVPRPGQLRARTQTTWRLAARLSNRRI
ncbi:hypothetical protein ACIQMR_37780 [Streptomyces sp. NPDC091376]|uniref:hypothetical protein n=1 Tax=Streptomyces sp. NPDC091376 TaxID=3365994 RepID=UPI0038032D23